MVEGPDSSPKIDRDELLADRNLVGAVFCRAYARRVDEWLESLFEASLGGRPGISLVAVGGYGRSHLSPESDLDVMLLHDGWDEAELEEAAQALWFPVWDAHISLGHSVRTVRESLELAATDLDTATSLLSLRHLAGDHELAEELADQSLRAWRKSRRKWLPQLIDDARGRSEANGEVAFLLEPDLKTSAGGLRDVNAVEWIEAADIPVVDQERRDLRHANDVLLAARVELHRSMGRKGDRLFLEEQDGVARALGAADADAMMSEIASAARTVTWIAESVFRRAERRIKRLRFRAEKPRNVADGVQMIDGAIALTPQAAVGNDAALMLRLAVEAAERNAPIDRNALDTLVELGPTIRTPWRPEIRELFVRLLRTGRSAIPVIETLDHVGLFTRLLPEWEPNRSKVQRNQYHRFTVDRHLLEAASNAAELTDRVERPDLLVMGALLHDIGKGYPGDHTEVGVELIDRIAPNMGFDDTDTDTLKRLCEHHLLLPDVATRRDIEDPGTIESVVEQVRTSEFLHLLAALTEADSLATGPSAWSRWKAHLLAELTRHTDAWLATDGGAEVESSFPDEAQRSLLAEYDHLVRGEGDTLTVITTDRPGVFARVSGAMALNYLNILGAQTHVEQGKALEVVRVAHVDGEDTAIEWDRVVDEVEDVMRSTEDLGPHFEMRARSRLGRVVRAPRPIVAVRVEFDNDVSATSTVIEVGGPDRLGLLYELSTALAEAGLDQQQTRVQTIGDDVVDAFYVRTVDGDKVVDPDHQERIRSSLLEILEREPSS